jgi:metal-responsive CopG/Arc/MetJ family transcriptional regulator
MNRQDKSIAKKRGRPATGTSPTIGVRVPDELTEKIDNWRSEQRPIPSRPEAIRQLVELALKAKVRPSTP